MHVDAEDGGGLAAGGDGGGAGDGADRRRNRAADLNGTSALFVGAPGALEQVTVTDDRNVNPGIIDTELAADVVPDVVAGAVGDIVVGVGATRSAGVFAGGTRGLGVGIRVRGGAALGVVHIALVVTDDAEQRGALRLVCIGYPGVVERHGREGVLDVHDGLAHTPALVAVGVAVEVVGESQPRGAIVAVPAAGEVVAGTGAAEEDAVVGDLDVEAIAEGEGGAGDDADLVLEAVVAVGRFVVVGHGLSHQGAQDDFAVGVAFIVDLPVAPLHAAGSKLHQASRTEGLVEPDTTGGVVRQGQQVDLGVELAVAGVDDAYRDGVDDVGGEARSIDAEHATFLLVQA